MEGTDREIILDALSIQKRIVQLGEAISRDYAAGNLLVLGVLKGAFVFMADLIRAIDIPMAIDFIQVSSYGKGASSSGDILLRSAPTMAVRGYDVLLVEDIVDSGLTVQWLVAYLADQGANSVKVCALIDKAERRTHLVPIDYCGFSIPEGFLVGYGLDFNEQYRHLPAICHLKNPL
jgi:hypoxanthine phosphoribosyltransferase